MPRRTLDTWVYKIKTMEVLLTKHKESDIYNHMVKMHSKAEELFEKYNSKYQKILEEFNDDKNHIYARYNWRQGEPSRFWKKNADTWYLTDVDEDQKEFIHQEYFMIYEIYCDFMMCDKYISEWQNEKDGWDSMVYDMNRYWNVLKNIPDTIKLYEYSDFVKFKKLWEETDKEWIEEHNKEKEHNKVHPKIQLPSVTDTSKEPDAYPTEPLLNDCSYCRKHWEEMKPKYEKAIQIWSLNKQEDDEYNRKQQSQKVNSKKFKVKLFEHSLEVNEDEIEYDLHCELCNHTADNKDDLDKHYESERHLKKERYCHICDLQCKSDYDYKNHLETTKHKKNAGLIDNKPKVFKCEHCDYQTITKANYERHLYSKHKNV